MHIMFICHGNICRSPMGERVARKIAAQRGLDWKITSAGVSSEEQGNPIDYRARQLLKREGYEADGHRARRVELHSARDVDLFVAAEGRHRDRLVAMGIDPEKVKLVSDFDPEGRPGEPLPDPWYGDMSDFVETLEVLERAIPVMLSKYSQQQ